MKKTSIITILLFSFLSFYGQDYYDNIYKFSDSILKKSSNYEAATYLSYIGEYSKALESMDKHDPSTSFAYIEDSLDFKRFHPVNAIEFIVNKSKTEQIVIINEAHHQPYHRAFTSYLLQGLYNQGYRYLGAETISAWDSSINERKYPTQNSGIYTQEPVYGNLIRRAMEIGFYIFPYETTVFITDSTAQKQREIEQAKNIKKILDKDPKAKILIHCGYDHLIERDIPVWEKAMAGRLFEFTGINPFTINQVKLTERSSLKYENSHFKMMSVDYSAIFIDSIGNLFNGSEYLKDYDVDVYHPRTKWIEGRPNWIFENNRKTYYLQEEITTKFPCLVFAYLSNEMKLEKGNYETLIPFDIIELKNKQDKNPLSLKKGDYEIIIRDHEGTIQQLKVKQE